ncbi:hypothetical protein Tco_0178847 [Tanacetum coccineum]
MKRVNTFVAMGSKVKENKEKKEEGREETAKGSRKRMLRRKRAVKEQQEESSKKQKVEKEKESEEVVEDDGVELKKLLVIKKDEDIAIDAIPLATKLPVIIEYKLHKEGMLVHYELIRADGSSKRYSSMIRMLQGIDKENLEALWRIVKGKYGDTRPEYEFERVYGDLRVMFEPDIKSDVWRMLQGYRVKNRSRIGINKLLEDLKIISEELAEFINSPSWNRPTFYDVDDDEYTIIYRSSKAITPDLSIEEPDKSLSMGGEHLSTIPETESNEVIKSSVENLVPIPSESEGISDDTCDVPVCEDSSTFDALKDHYEILFDSNDDDISSDDYDFEDIEYVDASLLDSELVNDVDQEKEEIDLEDILQIQDVILREKLLNINRLIANIESLNDNSTPDRVLKSPSLFPNPVADSDSFFEKSDISLSYSDNSLPKFESFSDHTEETSSDSTTTHVDNSLPEYDSFHFEIEPDQGELTNVVMEDILGEPRVHMPNVLPTHPTLLIDSDFII